MQYPPLSGAASLPCGALIAALYTELSALLAPLSMGMDGLQLRAAEALTLLPEAVPALAVRCLLTNLLLAHWPRCWSSYTRRLREKPLNTDAKKAAHTSARGLEFSLSRRSAA